MSDPKIKKSQLPIRFETTQLEERRDQELPVVDERFLDRIDEALQRIDQKISRATDPDFKKRPLTDGGKKAPDQSSTVPQFESWLGDRLSSLGSYLDPKGQTEGELRHTGRRLSAALKEARSVAGQLFNPLRNAPKETATKENYDSALTAIAVRFGHLLVDLAQTWTKQASEVQRLQKSGLRQREGDARVRRIFGGMTETALLESDHQRGHPLEKLSGTSVTVQSNGQTVVLDGAEPLANLRALILALERGASGKEER